MRKAISAGILVLVSCGLLVAAAGCRSIQGKYVDPQEVRHGQDVGGVPVVVDRPRWLKVTHKRTNYVAYKVESRSSAAAAAVPVPVPAPTGNPAGGGQPPVSNTPPAMPATSTAAIVDKVTEFTRDSFETEIVNVGEVYAVDLLRPMSGTADHSLEFLDAAGHVKKIETNVTDNTLKDVLSNLGNIKSFIGFSGEKPIPSLPADVKVVETGQEVVAIYVYDVYELFKGNSRPVLVFPPPAGPCNPPCPPLPGVGPCPGGCCGR